MSQLELGIEQVRSLKPGQGFKCQQRVGLLASRVACSIGRTKDGKGYLYMRGYVHGMPIADLWEFRATSYTRTTKENGLRRFTKPEDVVAHALAQHTQAQ